jgi:hypothetical protein
MQQELSFSSFCGGMSFQGLSFSFIALSSTLVGLFGHMGYLCFHIYSLGMHAESVDYIPEFLIKWLPDYFESPQATSGEGKSS